jgi:DNA-binding MarR family transcriptional regulator
MDETSGPDLIEQVVADVAALYPDLEVIGLPIVGRILRLANLLEGRRERQLAEFGLTVADFDVLATLRRRAPEGSLNVRDLQYSMMLSSGGMTKRLDRLEKAELIERRPDPEDRRGVLIGLTADGVAAIDDAIPAVTRAETELVRSVISADRDRSRLEAELRRLLRGFPGA